MAESAAVDIAKDILVAWIARTNSGAFLGATPDAAAKSLGEAYKVLVEVERGAKRA